MEGPMPGQSAQTPAPIAEDKTDNHPVDYGLKPEHLDELFKGLEQDGIEIVPQ